MTRPVLRGATVDDLPAMVAVDSAAMGAEAWSEHSLAGALDPSTRCVVVAEADGVVGYAVLMLAGDSADVHRIAVAPPYQGRGLGGALLDALLGEAIARGCRQVLLEVADDDAVARGLYASAGFVQIDSRPSYYRDGRTALVLRRELGR